jgi:hypothetical protein
VWSSLRVYIARRELSCCGTRLFLLSAAKCPSFTEEVICGGETDATDPQGSPGGSAICLTRRPLRTQEETSHVTAIGALIRHQARLICKRRDGHHIFHCSTTSGTQRANTVFFAASSSVRHDATRPLIWGSLILSVLRRGQRAMRSGVS